MNVRFRNGELEPKYYFLSKYNILPYCLKIDKKFDLRCKKNARVLYMGLPFRCRPNGNGQSEFCKCIRENPAGSWSSTKFWAFFFYNFYTMRNTKASEFHLDAGWNFFKVQKCNTILKASFRSPI